MVRSHPWFAAFFAFGTLMCALTVVLFAPYAYYIPRSALAGILMLSSWRLVDRQQLVYYLRTTRFGALQPATTEPPDWPKARPISPLTQISA